MAKRRATRAADATLREELEAIGARLAQLGERSIAAGQDAAARELAELRDGLTGLVERASDGGEQAYDALVGTVRRQPLGSLATAFAVGLAAAMLFGHRR